MSKISQNFTLLVFLKERSQFTHRLCKYLSLIKFPYPVLFADGSISNENELILKDTSIFNFTYTYIRYPKDITLTEYYKKCSAAAAHIKTPYVMLADNDDFPLINGIKAAIHFLGDEKDYVGCNGRVAGIELFSNISSPYSKGAYFLPYYCNTMDDPVALDAASQIERISSYLKNFYSIYYSVFRTTSLQYTLNQISYLNFSELGIHELFLSFMMLAQGKIHTIPKVTYIRQKGSSLAAASQKDWMDRLFYTNWLEDLKNALKHVAEYIAENTKNDLQNCHNQIYDAFVVRQKARYIPNNFYLFKNINHLLNKQVLLTLFLSKSARFFPQTTERISLATLQPLCAPGELEQILFAVKNNC